MAALLKISRSAFEHSMFGESCAKCFIYTKSRQTGNIWRAVSGEIYKRVRSCERPPELKAWPWAIKPRNFSLFASHPHSLTPEGECQNKRQRLDGCFSFRERSFPELDVWLLLFFCKISSTLSYDEERPVCISKYRIW